VFGLGLGAGAVALATSLTVDAREQPHAELRFRLSPDYRPDTSGKARRALTRAILDFLVDAHPPGMTMGIWEINPRDMPYLEDHLADVVRAVFSGVKENLSTQPVDPVLLLSLLYNESRFSPTALSPSGALGIAQFMPDTAPEYGLGPIARPELWQRYRDIRSDARKLRAQQLRDFRDRHGVESFSAEAVIRAALAGERLEILAEYVQIKDAETPDAAARSEYVNAVREDLAQYNFFDGGREAMGILDARVTYDAVQAAVTYIARRLKENAGMTTSAIAAYNAGPAAVREPNRRSVLYEYGDIPPFPETVRYVQRVLVVYSEIRGRLG
jgi:hypothetical protein